jgi:hypothetical protein
VIAASVLLARRHVMAAKKTQSPARIRPQQKMKRLPRLQFFAE